MHLQINSNQMDNRIASLHQQIAAQKSKNEPSNNMIAAAAAAAAMAGGRFPFGGRFIFGGSGSAYLPSIGGMGMGMGMDMGMGHQKMGCRCSNLRGSLLYLPAFRSATSWK